MRDALASLTTRGRTFLAAGTTTVVCGLVLGQWAMIQLGALAILLPLCAALALSRSPHQLTLKREARPSMVPAGQVARIHLHLAHDGRIPSGTLLLEEVVPYALGQRPRFVLEGVGRGWSRDLTYPLRPEVRGRHLVGPMTVRVTDPFGMVELGRTFHSTTPLVATPRTVPLHGSDPVRAWAGSGQSRPRTFTTGQAEDVTVREYRQGDDVRRVHWPSSARTGELMVRREEQPWQARTVILLDTRSSAHRGRGAASSFEAAVSVAASVLTHLAAGGHEVQVATAAGLLPFPPTSELPHGARAADVLAELAEVQTDPLPALDVAWLAGVPTGTRVVAVLGAVHDVDHAALGRLERQGQAPRAILLDVDAWHSGRVADGGPAASATWSTRLSASGWRVAVLGPHDGLDEAWRQVSR